MFKYWSNHEYHMKMLATYLEFDIQSSEELKRAFENNVRYYVQDPNAFDEYDLSRLKELHTKYIKSQHPTLLTLEELFNL